MSHYLLPILANADHTLFNKIDFWKIISKKRVVCPEKHHFLDILQYNLQMHTMKGFAEFLRNKELRVVVVIVVIAVLVVNSQQVKSGRIKLAAAFGADRAVDLQRFRPVVGVIVNPVPHPFEDRGSLIGAG